MMWFICGFCVGSAVTIISAVIVFNKIFADPRSRR